MKYFKILLIHVLLGLSNLLLAQQYPVNVNGNLVTPMPAKLSNFYADNVQKFFVTLTNKDLTNLSIPAKLKLTIIGSSVQIASRVGAASGIVPILLEPGVPLTLTQQDLTPYFAINNVDFVGGFSKSQYLNTGVLPEGNYAISVQVLDFYNNRPLSKPFSMYGSVFFSQPPTLLSPQVNNTINGLETTVIPFNWVPAHLNNRDVVAGGYKYIFTLKELLIADQNINQAYSTATTKLVEEVSTTQFMLNTLVTPLLSGRKYAWTVQVKANNPEAQYTLANNGISQIWGFTYDDNCRMPTNIKSTIQQNNSTISWTNSTFGKVSSVRYKEVNGVEYEKQLIQNASTVSLTGLLYGKNYEYALVVKCGSNTLVMNPRSFTVPPKSSAVKATGEGQVYWGVQEGQKSSDYTATGFDLKTIFQGTSTKTIKALIPNHKLGLSAESNDATVTLNACVGTVINKKTLTGAKVELWENNDIIESSTTNTEGNYKITIDTGRMINNVNAQYYLKFSRPDNLMGRDSINLSKLPTGKDILNKVKGKQITLFSSNYLVIHPVVYVGVNQVAALQKKANGKVEVFIHTNDAKSLPNRILNYTENIPANESYNGESYALIGTLNDANAFLPIETLSKDRENLLFKVSLKDYPTQYYVIKTLPENLQSQIVNIPLDYNPMVKVQGKIYKNAKKELEELNKSAVIAYDNNNNKILDGTTTHSDGTYILQSVPFSQVQNLVFYAAPFNESTKAIDQKFTTPNYNLPAAIVQSNPLNQDMNYGKTPVDIVYGQALLSETGKAVANAYIYYNDVWVGQTSEDGFFAFKMSNAQKEPKNFKIICDRKVLDPSQTISIIETAFSKWEKQVQPSAYNKTNADKDKPNSALLNHFVTYAKQYDDRNAKTISILVDTTVEKLGNYYLANCPLKYTYYNKIIATYRGVKQTVLVKDLQENLMIPMNTGDTTVSLRPDIDRYQVKISPAPNQAPFVDIKNLVINFSPNAPSVTVVLRPVIKISGTVTDRVSNKVLDSATIKVERLDAQTVSNTEGVFEVVFGETSEAKLTISREGYFAKDTIIKLDNATSKAITIQLEAVPFISIAQLAGFDAEVTRQVYVKNDVYKIWGRILVSPNGIFSLNDQTSTLTFNNILVSVGADGNARPLLDSVTFAESQINGKMFDFAPIDIRKIQLRKKMEVREFSKGVITGLVTVKASTFPSINKNFPLTFSDATLQLPDMFTYLYLFTSDKQKIKALDEESTTFYLKFNQADQGYVKSPFLKTGRIDASQDSCVISQNGINLIGNMVLPNAIFTTNSNIPFKDLKIDNQLNIADYEINFSRAPLTVGVKKWRLEIEKLKFNTQEKRLYLDGKLYVTKKNTEGKNVLAVKMFYLNGNDGGGVDVLTEVTLPSKGLSIKNLTFMPEDKEIVLPYTDAEGFTLKSSGTLTTTDADQKSMLGGIFPLKVLGLNIKSKNWAVTTVLIPNTIFKCDAVQLIPTQAILQVGTDVSIDNMNKSFLNNQELGESSEELDAAYEKTNWAFGAEVAVGFVLAELSARKDSLGRSGTAFVGGNFNNTENFKINDMDLDWRTPAMTLQVTAKINITNTYSELSGVGPMKVSSYSLGDANFYYKKVKTETVCGGQLLKAARNLETGPVTWDNIDGSFEYNYTTKNTDVFLKGTVVPNGSTLQNTMIYFDVKTLKVAFTANNCGYGKPILIGESDVYRREELEKPFKSIKNVVTEIDFCKNTFLIAVHSDLNDFIPKMETRIDGLLYVAKGSEGNKSMILMAVNGRIKRGTLLNVDGQIGLGINFDIEQANTLSPEVKNAFNSVPSEVKYGISNNKMDALYVAFVQTKVIPDTKISFDYDVVSATVVYSANITVSGNLMANFGTATYKAGFGIKGTVAGAATADLFGYTITAGLNADFDARLSGSYTVYNGWDVNGYLKLKVKGYVGNCFAKCNTACLETSKKGIDVGAKACIDLKMLTGWSTNNGFYYSNLSPE